MRGTAGDPPRPGQGAAAATRGTVFHGSGVKADYGVPRRRPEADTDAADGAGAGGHPGPVSGPRLVALAVAAVGIVFGDIGTSPLYALRETFHFHHLEPTRENVLGVLSLIIWSLILIISVKYLTFVMRADNNGEGGILALTAMIIPTVGRLRRRRAALILVGLFGTALLYGDGVITPAISVLSAVEGTAIVTPSFASFVVPLSVVILVGLFAIQSRGTTVIGRLFGPVMLVWFTVLAVLGLAHLIGEPGVLAAVNPLHGLAFFAHNGTEGFLALGSVILVVTGGEALYADMGHFGRRPIQLSWFSVVLPALVLNYLGQGALLLQHPDAVEHPFYGLAPAWGLIPLVALATLATVIASQALISGVFSLTMQAMQLGYVPRMRMAHTSASSRGQIYIPAMNWALMVACVGLVVVAGSSSRLASAYGLAVAATMSVTTVLFYLVLRERFRWPPATALALCGGFLVVDLAFLGANLFKIPSGGWFPLVVAAAVMAVMTTWATGRRIVAEYLNQRDLPLGRWVAEQFACEPPRVRVPGSAVYLFSVPGVTPPALVANVRHNHVLHETLLALSIVTDDVPHVAPADRSEVSDHGHGVSGVVLHYGFMEDPDVPRALTEGDVAALDVDWDDITYFLGGESLRIVKRRSMALWREHLFAFMVRNATPAAAYFGLDPARTVTLAQQVEI
jgi:KUP system potassium uptake protein